MVEQHVYIIEAQNGLVKIGTAQDPKARLAQVRTHSPVKARLVAVWLGDSDQERELHKMFRRWWSHCEWFRCEGAVARFVEMVRGRGVKSVPEWSDVQMGYANRTGKPWTFEQRAAHSVRMKQAFAVRREGRMTLPIPYATAGQSAATSPAGPSAPPARHTCQPVAWWTRGRVGLSFPAPSQAFDDPHRCAAKADPHSVAPFVHDRELTTNAPTDIAGTPAKGAEHERCL